MAHAPNLEKPKSRQSVDIKNPALMAQRSQDDLKAIGKALRDKCRRASHVEWKPPHDRPDPVRLVLKADEGRVPELLPLRHGRMTLSPFTFYRGSALAMAEDLAGTPASGVRAQCGGDSHLVNFRGLATAERRVIFAINAVRPDTGKDCILCVRFVEAVVATGDHEARRQTLEVPLPRCWKGLIEIGLVFDVEVNPCCCAVLGYLLAVQLHF
jgi:Uncharacterized protein conserved in bacteria (DUF2252)